MFIAMGEIHVYTQFGFDYCISWSLPRFDADASFKVSFLSVLGMLQYYYKWNKDLRINLIKAI